MTYRAQVVSYILNLMGRDSALPSAATANVDPFTSSGAYVPGASALPAPGSASQRSDPFTSGAASFFSLPQATSSTCCILPEQ
jgi:hypothetical protein